MTTPVSQPQMLTKGFRGRVPEKASPIQWPAAFTSVH